MTKKYRVLALLVAVLLVVGLVAACAGPAQPQPPAATPTPAAPQPPTNGGGPAEVTEVVIGSLGPLTGPVAQFGTANLAGIQLYVDQFNARGGLQIRLEIFDEEGQATLGVAGYFDLVDRGVHAIIGAVTSGVTMAVVPLAYEDNMPMITATSTHANVTVDANTGRVFTNMFRSCFIDPFQGQKMADFAYEIVGAETVAILFNNEVDYSIGLMQAFEARANELGLEIVAIETFQVGVVDFRSQLTNIARQNPDVLFIPAYYQDIALIGPQSVAAGLDTVLLGADGWATILDFMTDPSSIEGSFFLTGFSPDVDDPLVQNFIADFEAANGFAPNMFAAQAYDAAMILIAAIEAAIADGFAPDDAGFSDSVIAHMAATDLVGVTGHITFDHLNNPIKTAVILTIENGQERFWGYF
ncbi:MAG: ABC transporter substrate-binding protein [Oscillospiraceae bacterium]|nr:ABC transporter substrate-binding protein [Oscillospiraceae bacterium]